MFLFFGFGKKISNIFNNIGKLIADAIGALIGTIFWEIYRLLLFTLDLVEFFIKFIAGIADFNGKNLVDEIIKNEKFQFVFSQIFIVSLIIAFGILIFMIIKNFTAKIISEKLKETLKKALIGLISILLINVIFFVSLAFSIKAVNFVEILFKDNNGNEQTLAGTIFINNLDLNALQKEKLREYETNNLKGEKIYNLSSSEIQNIEIGRMSEQEIKNALLELEKDYIKTKEAIDAINVNDAKGKIIEEEAKSKKEMLAELYKSYQETKMIIVRNESKKINLAFGGTINYFVGIITIIGIFCCFIPSVKNLGIRIFHLIGYYLSAPILAATYALDNGARFDKLKKAFIARILEVVVFFFTFQMLLIILGTLPAILKSMGLSNLETSISYAFLAIIFFEGFNKLQQMFLGFIDINIPQPLKQEKGLISSIADKTAAGKAANKINEVLNENDSNLPNINENLSATNAQIKNDAQVESTSKVKFNEKASFTKTNANKKEK